MLENLADNVEAQQRKLAEVAMKPTLTRLVNRVAAYCLGSIPLEREEDGIAFACFPGSCPAIAGVLRRHLGAEARLIPFDENVMGFFLDKIYVKGKGINIHTFAKPDFLLDPAMDSKLFEAKVEDPAAAGSELPPAEIVLARIELSSSIANLDRPGAAPLDGYRLGEFQPAFRRDGNEWTVWSPEPLPDSIPVLVQFAEEHGGEEFYRDLSAVAVSTWPHVLFPSEIQLLGVTREGGIILYLDGSTATVRPGETREMSTVYHLVRHGYRFRRALRLTVSLVARVRRTAIRYMPPFRGAGAEELRTWLNA
jgi:hypothetical protein